MTTKNIKEAEKIARALLDAKLAACTNIINNMTSLYRWEGKIQRDKEVILIAKTRHTLVKKLIKKAKSLHSYTCPCIVSLPILDGDKDFIKWIDNETCLNN